MQRAARVNLASRRALRRMRARGGFRFGGDDFEIGARGLVRFAAALFPVAQGAERNAKARGEFLLAEAQCPADDFRARHLLHPRELRRGQRPRIWVLERGRHDRVIGHRWKWAQLLSGFPSKVLAHAVLPVGLK